MDRDELAILRDVEHAETEAANAMEADPEGACAFMNEQVDQLAYLAERFGHPGHKLLHHCLWIGWEHVNKVWAERHNDDSGPEDPAEATC